MDFLFSFIVTFFVMWFAFKLGQHSMLSKLANLASLDDDDPRQDIVITLERHPEGLFAYKKDDGQFIANDVTAEGLFQRIKQRFPGGSFRLIRPEWATDDEYVDLFRVIDRTFRTNE